MGFASSQVGGAQTIEQSLSKTPITRSRLILPRPSILRSVVVPRLPAEASQAPQHLDTGVFRQKAGSGVKGAIVGALLLGTAAAVAGSQLCEKGEDCTGTAIGFGLIGATIGAVIGAFVGSAAGGDDSEEADSPAPELPPFEPQSRH